MTQVRGLFSLRPNEELAKPNRLSEPNQQFIRHLEESCFYHTITPKQLLRVIVAMDKRSPVDNERYLQQDQMDVDNLGEEQKHVETFRTPTTPEEKKQSRIIQSRLSPCRRVDVNRLDNTWFILEFGNKVVYDRATNSPKLETHNIMFYPTSQFGEIVLRSNSDLEKFRFFLRDFPAEAKILGFNSVLVYQGRERVGADLSLSPETTAATAGAAPAARR